MHLDAKNVTRIALYTFMAIVGAALLVAVIFFIAKTTGALGDDSTAPPESTNAPPQSSAATDAVDSTDAPETKQTDETRPPDTTAPPETTAQTLPAVTEAPFTVNSYDSPVEMYALYNANARIRPSVDSDIMVMVYQGDPVNVYGETDNGWYHVRVRGYDAYIRMDLLTSDASQAEVTVEEYATPKTMYTQSRVNVRESWTTSATAFELYEAGTEVTVTGHTSNGWYRIVYNESVAYISDDYIGENMPIIEPDREP